MMLQLNPPIHLWVPHARDYMLAWLLIDYHTEEHLYWVGPMQGTGEIWVLANDKVRADTNITIGRTLRHPKKGGDDVQIHGPRTKVPLQAVLDRAFLRKFARRAAGIRGSRPAQRRNRVRKRR